MSKNLKETSEWIEYIKKHIRADFDAGEIYWQIPMKGRRVFKPLGCLDTNGYVKVKINYVSTYTHRVIWILAHGYLPKMLDHINQNPSDNRLCNLRETDHSKNGLNSKDWSTNTTGIKGVSITKYGSYKANKSQKHLGTFKTLKEAIDAYNRHE